MKDEIKGMLSSLKHHSTNAKKGWKGNVTIGRIGNMTFIDKLKDKIYNLYTYRIEV